MATKRAKSERTRKTTPIHPAFLALQAIIRVFVEACTDVASTFWSDLKHDERAIYAHPGAAFGWIIHPCATHMLHLEETPGEAHSTVIREGRGHGGTAWPMMVANVYRGDSPEFFFWDTVALIRCDSPQELHARMMAHRASMAIEALRPKLTTLREDLRLAGDGESTWRARLTGEIAEREREIADLEEVVDSDLIPRGSRGMSPYERQERSGDAY
jgi:hypothetical protein